MAWQGDGPAMSGLPRLGSQVQHERFPVYPRKPTYRSGRRDKRDRRLRRSGRDTGGCWRNSRNISTASIRRIRVHAFPARGRGDRAGPCHR